MMMMIGGDDNGWTENKQKDGIRGFLETAIQNGETVIRDGSSSLIPIEAVKGKG